MFDFSVVTHWVDQLLRSFLPEGWAILTEFILIGLCLLVGYAVIALVLICLLYTSDAADDRIV